MDADAPKWLEILKEAEGKIQALESLRQNRLDGWALSQTSKLPFNALGHRETLTWRMAELSRGALEHFLKRKFASAILLTRAAIETCSALWCLKGKLGLAIQSQTVGDIDPYLLRLIMGNKGGTVSPEMPEAINALTFVDHVNKDVPHFRDSYNILSEFSHPNYCGTTLLYSKRDSDNPAVLDFGPAIRGDSARMPALHALIGALRIFEASYAVIGDLMPAFVVLCEKSLNSHSRAD